jgi:fermentation-respiration switch protein FrsA (DUF1100 family)
MARRRALTQQSKVVARRRRAAASAILATACAVALPVIAPWQTTGAPRQRTSTRPEVHSTTGSARSTRRLHSGRSRIVGTSSTEYVFKDPSRTVTLPSGQVVPRLVRTIVLYPRLASTGPGAPIRRSFPLIVFGHGFALSPQPYHLLLDRWARAGYVVAAPIFPLENARALGGPNEHDLANEPGDFRLVIDGMLKLSAASGPLARLVSAHEIAVAGHSDGGDAALGAAYDPAVRDRRIKAAVILSGAEDPFAAAFSMPSDGPPLLAIQGTADPINPPASTYQFFDGAAPPKYLLRLIGSGHLVPYTEAGKSLTDVERMTLAFLDEYLKNERRPLARLARRGDVGPETQLTSER